MSTMQRRWPRLTLTGVVLAAFILAFVLAVVLSPPGADLIRSARCAPADEGGDATVDPEAQRLYQEGLRHYRGGDYTAAIAALERAYVRAPAAPLLYNLAQAHRMQRDCVGARDLYRRFLTSHPDGVLRQRAEAQLSEMEACSSAQPHQDPPLVAGTLSPAEPASAAAAPPVPTPATVAPARPRTLTLALSSDTSALEAAGRQPLQQPPAPLPSWRKSTYVAGGTAVALAALSVYFGWRTRQASAVVSDTFRPGNSWNSSAMDAEVRGRLSYKLELATAGGALVTGGLAAWLYYRAR